jgi:hypothetical protein
VILGEDLRKPAYKLSAIACSNAPCSATYIELRLLDIFEEDGHRVLARLIVVDIACPVGSQVRLAILVLRDLELSMRDWLAVHLPTHSMRVPLIQPDLVLDEKQRLLRQERRAQCGSEVELVQEHSDHLMCSEGVVSPS